MNGSWLLLLFFSVFAFIANGKTYAEEILGGFIKLIPMFLAAFVTAVLKLIVESKKNKITPLNIFLSCVFAIGIAYLFSPVIIKYLEEDYHTLAVGALVLTGEKIFIYLIYKAKIDDILIWAGNTLSDKFKNIFK